MIPTNKDNNNGCVNTSSNCVIWQGPDIECISLCKGDTVTDVIFRLATELCEIMDQLDLDNYDLTCLDPICPRPEDFQDLIQILINRICELEDCCDGTTPNPSAGCPDCIVNIAACFQYVDSVGDLVTTMQLQDYVLAIGTRICEITASASTVRSTVDDHEVRIRVVEVAIEDFPVEAEIFIQSSCLLTSPPVGGWPIETILTNLESRFCELRAATGLPNEIYLAIAKQCGALDQSPTLINPNSNMGSIPGWVTQVNYTDLADSINNMWLTICDLRAAVMNIQTTCCSVDCQDMNVIMTASLSDVGDILTVFFTGSIPVGFQDCLGGGNLITVTDSNGSVYQTTIPVVLNMNQPGVEINLTGTPVNTSLDLTITLTGCWKDVARDITCGKVITYLLVNNIACPAVVITPTFDQISFSFTNSESNPITYTVELWNGAGDTLLMQQVFVNPAVGAVAGILSGGIISGTTYKLRIKVTLNGTDVYCPFSNITTLSLPCPPPTDVTAEGAL